MLSCGLAILLFIGHKRRDDEPRRVRYLPQQDESIDAVMSEVAYRRDLTPAEQRFNKILMDQYIEKFPNSKFHQDNPEFMEDYLSRVDISELGLESEK